MKNKKRLSIILSLVLILTSFEYVGVFALPENTEGENPDQNEVVLDQQTTEGEGSDLRAATFTITWLDQNGGPLSESEVAEGQKPEYPGETPTKAADDDYIYTFAGWATEANQEEGTTDLPEATGPATYYAAFSKKAYFTITWLNEDGSQLDESKVAEGDVPEYSGNAPTKEADENYTYKFAGWTPELTAATADATYTAVFAVDKSKTGKPAKPAVSTFSSYKSIALEWTAVNKDTDGYEYDSSVTVGYMVDGTDVGNKLTYHTAKNLDPLKSYTYKVKAYITVNGEKVYSDEVAVSDSPVRPMRYKLNIKSGGTLKKHAGNGPKKYKLKKGVIYADRFQTGKYIFDYNGSTFYISRTRVKKPTCEYTNSFNYSNKEAEYYVNDIGASSGTNVLIFVSTYTQHVYYFTRVSGRWKCQDSWECSTGLASTPTPTGINGVKSINKKIKKKNGIKWWSTFNGNAALHGRKKNKPVGKPASNGCVRNPEEKAYIIYANAAKKSRVLIY